MKLKIKSYEIVTIFNLLDLIVAKQKQARALNRFKKLLLKKLEEYDDDEKNILKEYCILDENGELIINDNNEFTFKQEKIREGNEALLELKNEEQVISLIEFEPFLDSLIELLENCENRWTSEQIETYDLLLTKLEDIKEKI